eukprot:5514425-Prymnesium_polylepis.1
MCIRDSAFSTVVGTTAGAAEPGGAAGATALVSVEAARRAQAALVDRYDGYTADEARRTLAWLCAWARLS